MQLTIQGKQIELGAALRTHVTEKIEDINEKYFNHATFANITFSREGHGHGLVKAHISIGVGKSIAVMSDAAEGDAYLAFDVAAAKVAKQLRRYKSRLREHRDRLETAVKTESIQARYYTLAGGEADHDEDMLKGKDPVVVAELVTDIQTLSVSDAVMRLDLTNANALMFRNPSNGELNMVYRRPDGNIGWVDPAGTLARKKPEKKLEPVKTPAKTTTKTAAKPTAKSGAKTKARRA